MVTLNPRKPESERKWSDQNPRVARVRWRILERERDRTKVEGLYLYIYVERERGKKSKEKKGVNL